jgi:hypothetical protein
MLHPQNDTTHNQYPPGFLTLPDVEHHFEVARKVTGALVISYLPLVQPEDLGKWKAYSQANQGWVSESNGNVTKTQPILPDIWDYAPEDDRRRSLSTCEAVGGRRHLEENDTRVPLTPEEGPFSPVWTLSPPPLPEDTSIINYNLFAKPVFKKAVDFIEYTRKPTFLDVCNQAKWFGNKNHADELQTVIAYPVFADFSPNAKIVGHLTAIIPWRVFFEDILSQGTEPITVVLENTCNEKFSFEIQGHDATLIAEEDTHDPNYDDLKLTDIFAEFANPKELLDAGLGDHCVYTIHAYPTQRMESNYNTQEPLWYALVVLGAFLSTALLFLIFDCLVQKRQAKVVVTALKQNAIVSSLFPKNVQAQMMAEAGQKHNFGKAGIKTFLSNAEKENETKVDKSKPIADLFPETTIMFADIAG